MHRHADALRKNVGSKAPRVYRLANRHRLVSRRVMRTPQKKKLLPTLAYSNRTTKNDFTIDATTWSSEKDTRFYHHASAACGFLLPITAFFFVVAFFIIFFFWHMATFFFVFNIMTKNSVNACTFSLRKITIVIFL